MTRSAALPAALTALAAVVLLAACAESPVPAQTPVPPSATKSAAPGNDAQTPAPVEAVLVVASVDPDGAHVTASGYLQGVVRDGGTCVYTFSGSGSEFTVEQEAAADRMTTSCGTVQVPFDKFTRGSWTVTVGVTVNGRTVTSQPTTVEVP